MNLDKATLLKTILGGIFALMIAIITINPNIIFDPQPSIIDVTTSLQSPQPRGTSITWTANANDKYDEPIYYKFLLNGPSTDYLWKEETTWSDEKAWRWNTSSLDIGNYTLKVLVTDKKFRLWGQEGQKAANFLLVNSAEDWYNIGVDFDNKSRYNDALNAFDRSIEMNPQYIAAVNRKGETLIKTGMYQEARETFRKTIMILKNSNDQRKAEAENGQGVAFAKEKNYKQATPHFEEAIKINASYAEAWRNKGDAFINRNQGEKANEAYDSAIKIDPQNAEAWNGKGIALKLDGRNTEADAAFERSRELGYRG